MKSRFFPSFFLGAAALFLAALPVAAQRSGYAHVTDVDGAGSVLSDANGRTEIQVNLPLAEGDQIVTDAGGHAEIELADGNRVQIAGESRVRLDALAGEDGSDAQESAITLLEGSLAVESAAFDDSRALRVDTPDTSVYVTAKSQARVNLDANRGTSVIARAGSVDVQTRSGAITAEAGQYVLVRGDDQPELARGSFSRDRFDIWVADRTQTALAAYNSVSARYVDGDEYDQDVASLDDYGSWDYSPTYDTEVWRPNVAADWSPYSDGYWYYTPVGASWVDNEPWGWFPNHFGNWFFDAAFGSWCWSPAFVYSPAWVYWGFGSGYVGWCPIGSYAYYGPYSSYWGGYGGWHSGLYFSVNGVFDRGQVDWHHGWNFVGDHSFGSRFNPRSVLPGSAVASRLGARVAITSDPLRPAIVSGRGSAVTALRSYVRTAPAAIARQSSPAQTAALAPYLGRQARLPAATVRTLQDTQLARVNPSARRLEGPGADRLGAPSRQTASISGSRSLAGGAFRNPGGVRSESWRAEQQNTFRSAPRGALARPAAPNLRSGDRSTDWRRPSAVSPRSTDWRRPSAVSPRSSAPVSPRSVSPRGSAGVESWRQRSAPARPSFSPRSGNFQSAPSESWRSRANTPPAQRVIEGIDRGRAVPPTAPYTRSLPARRPESLDFAPREVAPSRGYERSTPPAYGRSAPPPAYGRSSPPPAYGRSAPPPEVRRAEPAPRYSAPPPRYERPAPPTRSAAPPPARGAPAPRPAPPPSRGGEYRPPHAGSHR